MYINKQINKQTPPRKPEDFKEVHGKVCGGRTNTPAESQGSWEDKPYHCQSVNYDKFESVSGVVEKKPDVLQDFPDVFSDSIGTLPGSVTCN